MVTFTQMDGQMEFLWQLSAGDA